MDTIYFNELSLDPRISSVPETDEEIKQLLVQFIKTSLSYFVSIGSEDFSILSNEEFGVILSSSMNGNVPIVKLINDIDEEVISYDEKSRFKTFVSESFKSNWQPEYILDETQAFGLGEASLQSSYSISFGTVRNSINKDWADSTVELKKHSASAPSSIVSVKNLSAISHVFTTYEVWRNCKFKHKYPKEDYFLPNAKSSKYIIEAFNCVGWDDFYTKYRTNVIDRTQCLKIAQIVANINGWDDFGTKQDNQWTQRRTFKAKNHYLQIDTEKGAFEVYRNHNKHLGEILFNANKLEHPDSNRFIRL